MNRKWIVIGRANHHQCHQQNYHQGTEREKYWFEKMRTEDNFADAECFNVCCQVQPGYSNWAWTALCLMILQFDASSSDQTWILLCALSMQQWPAYKGFVCSERCLLQQCAAQTWEVRSTRPEQQFGRLELYNFAAHDRIWGLGNEQHLGLSLSCKVCTCLFGILFLNHKFNTLGSK